MQKEMNELPLEFPSFIPCNQGSLASFFSILLFKKMFRERAGDTLKWVAARTWQIFFPSELLSHIRPRFSFSPMLTERDN